MDRSNSPIDTGESSESDPAESNPAESDSSEPDREAEMEKAAAILEEYVSETPTSDLSDDVYTARLSGGERAFVESLRDSLNTNKGETIRLIVNLAAVYLEEVKDKSRTASGLRDLRANIEETKSQVAALEQQFRRVDEMGEQIDRIEERLEQREGTKRPSSSWEQGDTDNDDDDDEDSLYDDVADPEDIDIDLPDPDEVNSKSE
jgi:hypothetical protein